jgi:sugar phosphate isomerase/epimerase
MNNWEIGISTGCFYKSDLRSMLGVIIESGFSLLEVSSSPGHLDIYDESQLFEIQETLSNYSVTIYSVHAPFSKNIDTSSPDDTIRKLSQKEIFQTVKATSILKASTLILHPWPEKEISAHTPEHRLRKVLQNQFIDKLSVYCNEYGVTLALENMQPHLLISPLKDLLWIRKETELKNVTACLDTGHAFIANDLHSAIHELAGHISCFHVHDNFGKEDIHLLPGEGNIDWERFCRDLEEIDFNGPLIIELLDETDRKKPQDVLLEAIRTADRIFRI